MILWFEMEWNKKSETRKHEAYSQVIPQVAIHYTHTNLSPLFSDTLYCGVPV